MAGENVTKFLRESREQDFEEKYGLDSVTAATVYRDAKAFTGLLQTMYLATMDELRECDLPKDGARIQGQAQILWTLLNLPTEISEMKQ